MQRISGQNVGNPKDNYQTVFNYPLFPPPVNHAGGCFNISSNEVSIQTRQDADFFSVAHLK